jgi:hypothetical protein
MTDSAGKRIDAEQTKGQLDRIHDAIGRPVTKVFLDREDNVILDLGDLVTHQAVQRAYEAGQLDQLLGSVYKAPDISFTREEMKAPVPGDSTIEQASGGAAVVDELETKVSATQDDPDTQDPDTPRSDDPESSAPESDAPTDQAGAPARQERSGRRPKDRSTHVSTPTDQAGTPVVDTDAAEADEAAIGASVGIDEAPPELPERTGDRTRS